MKSINMENNFQENWNNKSDETFMCTSLFFIASFATDKTCRKNWNDETTGQDYSMSPSKLVLTVSNKVFTFNVYNRIPLTINDLPITLVIIYNATSSSIETKCMALSGLHIVSSNQLSSHPI